MIAAQDAFSKSVKQSSKKQSIPEQRSHYLLLMGNPVEDGRYHKGLGMILSSKHKEGADKLKDSSSNERQTLDNEFNHSETKSKPNLVSTLQKSSNGFSSDRDYSYTEALFTGPPLYNGRPYRVSDKTHSASAQSYLSYPNIDQSVKEKGKNLERYDGAEVVEPRVDKINDHNKQERNDQRQKEIHTEEGVTGIIVNKKPKGDQFHESSTTVGQEGERTNSLEKTPETPTEHVDNQFRILRPTNGGSPYKTHGETLENKVENQRPYKSDPLLQANAQQEENISSIDNDTHSNMQGSIHSKQHEKNVYSQLSLKSYDEESNLLGSNVMHGNLAHQHADHALDTDYYNAGNVQKDESTGKANEALHPGSIETNEKDTNPVSQEGSDNTMMNTSGNEKIPHESKGSLSSLYQESRNQQRNDAYDLPGNLPGDQNQVQSVTYDKNKNEDGNLNTSMTSPMTKVRPSNEEDREMENFTNQLRPHKIIESSFDEELTQTIATGPSSRQEKLGDLTKQPAEKFPSDMSHPSKYDFQSSSPYREGSTPSDFHRQNEKATKDQRENSIQESPSSWDTTPLGPLSRNQKETTVQQDTASQSSGTENTRLDNETTSANNSGYNKTLGNPETSQERIEHGTQTQDESSGNSTQPPTEYSSGQGETGARISASYREGSNPSEFLSRNEQLTENHREKSNQVGPSSSEEVPLSSLRNSHKEESAQQEESTRFSEGAFHVRPSQDETSLNNKGSYQESPGESPNLGKSHKEMLPSFYHRIGRIPSTDSPQKEGSMSYQVASLNNNKSPPNVLKESSDKMVMHESGVGKAVENEGTNYHQYWETLHSGDERGTQKNYESPKDSLRPSDNSLSGQEREREFQVGVPEQAKEVASEYQPIRANNNVKQTESSNEKVSEGIRNDQPQDIDKDNGNQKIVYFLKMVKGIPLLNNEPINDQHRKYKKANESGLHSPTEIREEEDNATRLGGVGSKAIHRRWNWQWSPVPSYKPSPFPSPSPSPVPSPLPSPVLSPSPSPSIGGGEGGALGGSSVDSNVPQGNNF